jgi:hypothetical protein
LPEIPEKERNPMFTQRLSLIVNTRTEPFEANDSFAEDVAHAEGEKILSYLVNLKEEECQYENPKALSKRWLEIQSPEISFLDKYFEFSDNTEEYPAIRVLKKYKEVTGEKIPLDTLISTTNIKEKVIQEETEPTGRQTEL